MLKRIKRYFQIMFWCPLYKEDKTVTKYVKFILDSRWENVDVSEFHLIIKTTDGYTLNFWNANKWYAWGSHGYFDNGNKKFYWHDMMPSSEMLWEMREQIPERIMKIATINR